MFGRGGLIITGVISLAVLWAAVWGVMKAAGVYEVTPEKVSEYVEAKPFKEIEDPKERRKRLDKIVEMTNKLNYWQRVEFREKEEGRKKGKSFFDDLTVDEQSYLVERTVGSAFKQMMIAFNEMSKEERRKVVARAQRELEEREGEQLRAKRLKEKDGKIYDRIVEDGLRAFYQDASAETKRDLAPLMEEMQQWMQKTSRGIGPGTL